MRQLDAQTIAAGASVDELMERAGEAVARAVVKLVDGTATAHKPVVVFAGKGNNAGDAFVATRHLAQAGHAVQLVMLARREELRDAALRNLRRLHHLNNVEILTWEQVTAGKPLLARQPAVVVDGLLGIGLSGEVREPFAAAIRRINDLSAPVVAVDVPSGLGTSCCVRATHTVTFGFPKLELLRYPDNVGRIEVVDIGLSGTVESNVELITANDVRPLFPPRRRSGHKGEFGHLLIVAGSVGYSGAPVLCAAAAARAGVGLVTLAVPRDIYPIVASHCPPEVMPRPLENLDYAKFDAIAVGPGIGRDVPWFAPLIRDSGRPLVLDADALNVLAGDLKLLKSAMAVLTPHPGEMARLLGRPVRDRWEDARAFAQQHNVTLVLKGAHTVVTDPTGVLWINATGNPGMAKGGMGDALTGILGAFVARGLPLLEAAKAAVHLHGLAGDLAAETIGEEALQTSDVIAHLPAAWNKLLSRKFL